MVYIDISGVFNIPYRFFSVTFLLVECVLQAMNQECHKPSSYTKIKAGLIKLYHVQKSKSTNSITDSIASKLSTDGDPDLINDLVAI